MVTDKERQDLLKKDQFSLDTGNAYVYAQDESGGLTR
jgi:hypothetical protein